MVKMLKMPLLTMFLSFLGVFASFLNAQSPEIETKTSEFERVRGGFAGISDLYVSPAGIVYLTDSRSHYLYRINPETGLVDSLGGRGTASTQFNTPVGVHATNDLRIFVNDAGNARIQVFDRRFQSMGQIAYPSGSRSQNTATGMHVTRDGGVVFWDGASSSLVGTRNNYEIDGLYRPDVTNLGLEIRALRSGNGEYLVVDASGKRVFRYQDNGRYIGFWEWSEPILDIRSTSDGYVLLTKDEVVALSGAWQLMWRMGHGMGNARVVFQSGSWLYLATEDALYRMPI